MTGTAAEIRHNPAMQLLGRLGLAGYGVVHLLICYLAIRVAVGDHGTEADPKGAITIVARGSFGELVLWVLAAGLIACGLWQLLLVANGFHWIRPGRERWAKKSGAGVRAVVVLALGAYAVKFALGIGGGTGDSQEQELTARLMSLPAGRVIVGVVALGVVVAGIVQIVAGFRQSFMDDLDTAELPLGTQRWVRRSGTFGYLAKGVAMGVVGLLLGMAALDANAGKAGGLDAALRTLGRQPFGVVLLFAVAIGFAAFGVYCFAAARYQRG